MDIISAINDRHLFRPLFKDLDTWAAWQAFLKSLFALPMTDEEVGLYQACTGRETVPSQPFRECWTVAGVRSGKSFTAALVSTYLATFRDYSPHLAKGERAVVLALAADRSQARVVFGYIRAMLNSNPMLRKMIEAERTESVDLGNQVSVVVGTSSYRSVRGYTCAAIVCDEIAFWRSDDSANPAEEVLRALRPRLATVPNSLLLCISSPYARSGPLYQAHKDHFGVDGSDVLVWQAETRTMNPTISEELIVRDLALDPEAAKSEWLAQFRSDLETFLPLGAIEACVVENRYELPPLTVKPAARRYTAFCDPSGGRGDAAALAISHREGEVTVIDLARRWRAPHSPQQVIQEQAAILHSYKIARVTGDRYAGEWPSEEFRKHNIRYESSPMTKSELYLELLPMVMGGTVELPDNKDLFNELRSLERRTRSQGRDLVDHPPRGHDDLANAVAGAAASTAKAKKRAGVMFKTKQRYGNIPGAEGGHRRIVRRRFNWLRKAERGYE